MEDGHCISRGPADPLEARRVMKNLLKLAVFCIVVTFLGSIHSQDLDLSNQDHSTFMEVTHGKP